MFFKKKWYDPDTTGWSRESIRLLNGARIGNEEARVEVALRYELGLLSDTKKYPLTTN